MKALLALSPSLLEQVYGDHLQGRITITNDPGEAEVLVTGWGAPVLDAPFLARHPNLKLVLYGAGSIRGIVTDAFWDRGIPICSAWRANAIPVAEYALGAILLSLKGVFRYTADRRRPKETFAGGFQSTVGLVSLGAIGRLMVERLAPFDLRVIASDPFVKEYPGVEIVPLPELFRRSDVVSIHTPWLPETEGLITGDLLASMRPYATFLNTSRGAVVDETALAQVLTDRPDLQAILDVTWPEPPEPDSPLWTLPNLVLTPHIAGAMGQECLRMGELMAGELDRFTRGEPLRHEVTRDQARHMA